MRKIIQIDEDKCNGCGLCIPNCAEGAIQIVGGVAKVIADKYCDGLGACLGHCPQDALKIVEREADDFDEEAVEELLAKQKMLKENMINKPAPMVGGGCPGSRVLSFNNEKPANNAKTTVSAGEVDINIKPQIQQWPVQLMLVPVDAPYFKNADLLVTADCVAVAYPNYQLDLLKGKKVVMGCPKLDNNQHYVSKLTDMIKKNDFNSITVAHMEVPCCNGIVQSVDQAVTLSGKDVKVEKIMIGVHGEKKSVS